MAELKTELVRLRLSVLDSLSRIIISVTRDCEYLTKMWPK
jgi:hypothetical protein